MQNIKISLFYNTIFVLILLSQAIYSQDRFSLLSKKFENVNELEKSVKIFIEDTYLLMESLDRGESAREYRMAEGYYGTGKILLFAMDYFLTVLEIANATKDDCYTNELVNILTKAIVSISSKIDDQIQSIDILLGLDTEQNVIDAGNELKTHLRNFKSVVRDWDDLKE